MVSKAEVILEFGYSEIASRRTSHEYAQLGVPSTLIQRSISGQPMGTLPMEHLVPLVGALYLRHARNIMAIPEEDYEVQDWPLADVMGLRVVPANGNVTLADFVGGTPPVTHPQDPRLQVQGLDAAALQALTSAPGVIGTGQFGAELVDGTFRTLARIRRGDQTFPMWTPTRYRRP